jgi:polar amino acid transport system substrate-binding protein
MVGISKTIIVGIIIAVIVIGAAAFMLAPKQPKLLRVGTSPDFPPFEYIDEGGNIVGFDIDMIRELAKMIGYDDIEIISIDFDGLIPALQNGQIDVIAAGMTITEERQQIVDFTVPYWQADQAIVVKKGSSFSPQSLDDLEGKIIGVQSGTTGEAVVDDFVSETGKEIDIRRYSSFVLAINDLVNGRIDAVVVDTPVAEMFTTKYDVEISAVIQTGEQYGLAVRKGDTELLNKLNQALQQLMGSEKWNQLIDTYFGG